MRRGIGGSWRRPSIKAARSTGVNLHPFAFSSLMATAST